MSERLPATLLLQWGEPLWRLRDRGLPQFCPTAAQALRSVQEITPQNAVFAGFFVPETLSDAAETLLGNILRACPWLGARHAFAQIDALLAAEGGQAWVFGEPEWWEGIEELPVRCIQLPDLETMLEEPLLKKRAYLTLLEGRNGV